MSTTPLVRRGSSEVLGWEFLLLVLFFFYLFLLHHLLLEPHKQFSCNVYDAFSQEGKF